MFPKDQSLLIDNQYVLYAQLIDYGMQNMHLLRTQVYTYVGKINKDEDKIIFTFFCSLLYCTYLGMKKCFRRILFILSLIFLARNNTLNMVYTYLNSQNNSIHKNRSMITYRTILWSHQKVQQEIYKYQPIYFTMRPRKNLFEKGSNVR